MRKVFEGTLLKIINKWQHKMLDINAECHLSLGKMSIKPHGISLPTDESGKTDK